MTGPAMAMPGLFDLQARIWSDTRFPRPTIYGDLRLFVLAAVWFRLVEQEEQPWGRVCEVMHLGNFKFWELVREDTPRYVPPREERSWERPCEGRMIRRTGPCGQRGNITFRITDPATGRWRFVSYCRRHQEQAEEAREAERARQKAGTLPTPAPNSGGLLPCYLPDFDWRKIYQRANHSWKEPAWGVRADDWPTPDEPAEETRPEPSVLKVILGGQEMGHLPFPGAPASTPPLRLIRKEPLL